MSERSFPARVKRARRADRANRFVWTGIGGAGVLLGAYPFLVGQFMWSGLFALPLMGWLFVGMAKQLLGPYPVRIIPLYQQPVEGAETYLRGHALAAHFERLERLAEGFAPLSDFGFADPLHGEVIRWHSPQDLLASVTRLKHKVDDPPLRNDLAALERGLELAAEAGTKIALIVEFGDVTNAIVWERRAAYA